MYKVAILGCENSHADSFLDDMIAKKRIADVEIVGIYSNEEEEAKRLGEKFGLYIAKEYDEFVGKVDGLIITARHGNNHHKYAKPYIESGIPMFIDKPIVISEQDAIAFMKELEKHHIRISGGSMCIYAAAVQELKRAVEDRTYGTVYGGYLRAPISLENVYGGFFFYAQHMVQVMCEIFGYHPKSVQVFRSGGIYTCVFRYGAYDVTGVYTDRNNIYYAGISCEKDCVGRVYTLDDCPEKEVDAFYHILKGGAQEMSYRDFFAPVFILNALYRSVQSGKEESVHAC